MTVLPETNLEVLRVAAAVGLPGVRLPDEPPRLTVSALADAQQHGIQGVLWKAIENGVVRADGSLVQDVMSSATAAMRRSLVAEATAIEVVQLLSAADVPTRVLKGVAIAHLDHSDPAERVCNDADVLVHRADHRKALAVLTAAGMARSEPPVRSWWERRYGKAVLLTSPGRSEVDLHLAITGGRYGVLVDHDELWAAAPDTFTLGGTQLAALPAEGRLLHACCHAVLGGGSGLRALRDVAQLVLITRCDWRAVADDATLQGVDAVVAAAVRRSWADLRLDDGHECAKWAEAHAAEASDEVALAAYLDAQRRGWGPEGRTMFAALPIHDKALFAIGLAIPSRAHRRHHQRSHWQLLRRRTSAMRRTR